LKLYRYFIDGIPHYLARHYWWAYLWRPAVWFFDHQIIINAILFGQYKNLMTATMRHLDSISSGQILQLTCVYGSLTSNILKNISPHCLHIVDVSDVQLEKITAKMSNDPHLLAARMNAEQLAYKDSAFSTIVLFFLLHEMPSEARRNTLAECMRVLSRDGNLLYTEYGPLPSKHLLYRFPLSRLILTRLEPFLSGYWEEDILATLRELGKPYGKSMEIASELSVFFGLYRVTKFRVISD
jgi:ubiquinone/menaquinone biosynthesis C-methylase UbiE